MTTAMRVGAIMQTGIVTLTPDVPIRRAVALLVEKQAAAAPVLDQGDGLCGILTQKDCFRAALHASYYQEWRGSVSDHMSKGAVTVDEDDDVVSAAKMFLDHPYRSFPVLKEGKLVGMLTRSSVLAVLYRTG